ncbi:50S ribosomal protein L30 [Candidatus Micrarchaeota archaeon]|nr:50S ribosomal protein L30 [Candidatus Micrarchaeota archaeon]
MFAAIRIRGKVDTRGDIEDTMCMMNLKKVNNCVVLPDNETSRGMLQKTKDYITYGEMAFETYEKMLMKWGRTTVGGRVNADYLKEKKVTAKELFEGKTKYKDAGIKQPFRLHPPRKGFKSTKRPFTMKGDLGYRKEKINDLIERMI